MSDQASKSGARVLRVLKALKGATLTGYSNAELAARTGESAPNDWPSR